MIGREKKEQIIAQLHDRLMTAQAVINCREHRTHGNTNG